MTGKGGLSASDSRDTDRDHINILRCKIRCIKVVWSCWTTYPKFESIRTYYLYIVVGTIGDNLTKQKPVLKLLHLQVLQNWTATEWCLGKHGKTAKCLKEQNQCNMPINTDHLEGKKFVWGFQEWIRWKLWNGNF